MDPVLLAAIISFAARYGVPAVMELFSKPIATLDDAIAALGRAHDLSLEQIIAEEAAKRLKALTPPAP